jgi:hypothetical protein
MVDIENAGYAVNSTEVVNASWPTATQYTLASESSIHHQLQHHVQHRHGAVTR